MQNGEKYFLFAPPLVFNTFINMMLRYSLLSIVLWLSTVMAYGKGNEVKVLQMNIWQEGTMVKGGFEAIADEVARLEPDIVMFSEVRNYHGKQFISRILQALEERGKRYYGENSKLDVGILSKYKIEEQAPNCPLEDDAGSVLKPAYALMEEMLLYIPHIWIIHIMPVICQEDIVALHGKSWMHRYWM